MHRLTFILNGEPRTFILERERVCLGRQAENDLAIPDHTVSRRHAEILKTAEGWRIADLGSRNGTAVNGEPVQESPLNPGDEITLGTFALRFEEEAEESVRLEADGLEGVLEKVMEVIFANGGTLDKFIGDAIMAIFGAPVLTTDHAHRAVRCALGMREALGRLNAENPDGPPLLFRIGINTGPVVAGDIGSVRRMDYTVLGAAVNAASRLESEVAKPGQIVVGEATYRQLKYAFAFHKAGKVPVKGLSRPLAVYEVKGELGVDDVLKL
ncbi:MAG: adenylate/guanylate cyclase domain-containing protein [Acidobacteriota bacterium]